MPENLTLFIDGAEKEIDMGKGITIEEEIGKIDTWSARLPKIESLTEFSTVQIKRDDTEIFKGRLENPVEEQDGGGSGMTVSGLGYSAWLKDYTTPYSEHTADSLANILNKILEKTPFTLGTVSTFYFSKNPWEYDTSMEYMQWVGSDVALVYDPTATFEVNQEVHDASTYYFPQVKSRNIIVTTSQIFYFFEDAAGNILYDAKALSGGADKGATDTTINRNVARQWAIGYNGTYAYLFVYDGANTDLYRGTIVGNTITFALLAGNIVAGWIQWAMALDNETHFWIAYNNAIYQSEDGGATWSNEGNTGGLPIHHIFMAEETGDMHVIVNDTVNADLEHWLWDESAGTLTFQAKIDDLNAALDHATGGVDSDYNIHLVWEDNFAGPCDINYCMYDADAGTWGSITLVEDHTFSFPAGKQPATGYTQACCDASGNVYVYWQRQTGGGATLSYLIDGVWYKNVGTAAIVLGSFGGSRVFCPQGYKPVNALSQGVCLYEDGLNDLHMVVLGFSKLEVGEGVSSGTITSPSITGDGDFERWGMLFGDYTDIGGILVDVLDPSDGDAIIASDLELASDLHEEGATPSYTSIKIKFKLTDDVTYTPFINSVYLTERWSDIEYFKMDNENVYTCLTRLADLVGAEKKLQTDDTLDFVSQLGTDYSSTVTLRHIQDINGYLKDPDFSNYINCIVGIGSGTYGVDRVEASLKNTTEIARLTALGQSSVEHWGKIQSKDWTTLGMLYTAMMTELASRAGAVNRYQMTGIDKQAANIAQAGNTVNIVFKFAGSDEERDLDLRFIRLTRNYNNRGETITGNLANPERGTKLINRLGRDISDAQRWQFT